MVVFLCNVDMLKKWVKNNSNCHVKVHRHKINDLIVLQETLCDFFSLDETTSFLQNRLQSQKDFWQLKPPAVIFVEKNGQIDT